MAVRNFQLTSQVGTRLTYVDPANFRHILTVNQSTTEKSLLGVSGQKTWNSKWSTRTVMEVSLPSPAVVDPCVPCQGSERVSIFIEVSGSVANKALVLEALDRAFTNARTIGTSATAGLPFTNHGTLVAGQ